MRKHKQQAMEIEVSSNQGIGDDAKSNDDAKVNPTCSIKLNRTNYAKWKVVVLFILSTYDYALEVVEGTLVPPIPSPKPTPAEKDQQKYYDKGNQMAKRIFATCIDPDIICDTSIVDFADNNART